MSQIAAPGAACGVAPRETAPCTYCHLPVPADGSGDGPVYCCLGCRLAAEITGQSGAQGAMQMTLARLGLAIFLSLNVMMFTMALWTHQLYDARGANAGPLAATLADLFRYLCLILSLPVLLLLGGPMLDAALANRRRGAAAADLLIVAGVAAAYVYSAISVVRGAGHVYFEVGCAVLVMVTLGRWLEANGKLKTTEALDALQKLLPQRVRTIDAQGREAPCPLEDVRAGDRLRVLAGERVATDGRVTRGRASLDQQMLTGESQPVTKQPGDAVLGGSLNLDGDLEVLVTTAPQNGSLARIVEMVRQARLRKGRYEQMADRVARWFLPLVMVIALGAFAFHGLRTSAEAGLLAGLAVLLIACPCALGLATPLAVWTALGTASRAGVLFRDGESLERLAAIRAVRFDKTGTLTTGVPTIRRFVAADPGVRDEALCRAACLARSSTHVFSSAIVRYAEQDGAHASTDEPTPARLRPVVCTSPGCGVLAQFSPDETPTRLGSLRWLERSRMTLGEHLARAVTDALLRGESFSAIGWDGRVQGLFVIDETLRQGAGEALQRCAAEGCDVALLTGDHAARARALARQLGVPVQPELLPADKVKALDKARAAHGPVAMVGDGVNDAPALAASDLGIAMGCGADVSRESAAICLIGNDLALVPWSIALARQTCRVVRQNLFWAFAYNTIGVGLAAIGWLNPAFAAAAMVVSSTLVVTNSLRLARLSPPARPQSDRRALHAAEASGALAPDAGAQQTTATVPSLTATCRAEAVARNLLERVSTS
jgi:heavy metal translocating P-type ATPase